MAKTNKETKMTIYDKGNIWTVDNVLSKQKCQELIESTEKIGYEAAGVTVGQDKYVMDTEIRNNTRVIWDNVELANLLWNCVKSYVPLETKGLKHVPATSNYYVVGLNERFRFYKYVSGQRFVPHYDGCFERYVKRNGKTYHQLTFITVIFYLNDVIKGGETKFCDAAHNFVVKPKQGDVLFFVHYNLHEGCPIPNGSSEVKYVMRTDVMFESPVDV